MKKRGKSSSQWMILRCDVCDKINSHFFFLKHIKNKTSKNFSLLLMMINSQGPWKLEIKEDEEVVVCEEETSDTSSFPLSMHVWLSFYFIFAPYVFHCVLCSCCCVWAREIGINNTVNSRLVFSDTTPISSCTVCMARMRESCNKKWNWDDESNLRQDFPFCTIVFFHHHHLRL